MPGRLVCWPPMTEVLHHAQPAAAQQGLHRHAGRLCAGISTARHCRPAPCRCRVGDRPLPERQAGHRPVSAARSTPPWLTVAADPAYARQGLTTRPELTSRTLTSPAVARSPRRLPRAMRLSTLDDRRGGSLGQCMARRRAEQQSCRHPGRLPPRARSRTRSLRLSKRPRAALYPDTVKPQVGPDDRQACPTVPSSPPTFRGPRSPSALP